MAKQCVCQGQCGRHEGTCPERCDRYSKLRLAFGRHQTACFPTIRQRADGQFWCSICWRIEVVRLRVERRNKAVEEEEQREADAARQGRLFDA